MATYVNNHIHTIYSFSPYTPTTAVEAALKNGLKTAGIMDHDSVGGAKEFIEAGKKYNMPVTVGVECRVDMSKTRLNGKRINNPDQKSVAYVAMHGIPHQNIDKVDAFFAPYNIKVNAVCPGNYLDGPLWSDPEKGLFVQYLNAGKVPGAKTVEDVRKFYMSKVPLNRGCLPVDVARAIMYCVEQKYETGQAIPVTGGQIMLH